jgi:hypothetical protein
MQTFQDYTNQWLHIIYNSYIAQGSPADINIYSPVMPPIPFMYYICENNIWNNPSYITLQLITLTSDNTYFNIGPQYIGRGSMASLLQAVKSIQCNKYWSASVGLPAKPWF